MSEGSTPRRDVTGGGPGPLRLSTGPTGRVAVLLGCLSTLAIFFTALLLVIGIILAGAGAAWAVVILGLLVVLVWVGLFLACARIYRMVFWLDGTVLVQRRPAGRRQWDLSTASVGVDVVAAPRSDQQVPRLVITVEGARPAILPLRSPHRKYALLPARQLTALADAIVQGREHDQAASAVADRLRHLGGP